MHLSGQQQPSNAQQEGGLLSAMNASGFMVNAEDGSFLKASTEKPRRLPARLPDNTLALLEARLRGMISMVDNLGMKNDALRDIIADRDARIAQMEQENTTLGQQVALFTVTNGQVIDGLADILKRFPGGEVSIEGEEGAYSVLEKAIGTA